MIFMLPVPRDPEPNFEKLWEIFHNRYPFFDLRNVDWIKMYEFNGSEPIFKIKR